MQKKTPEVFKDDQVGGGRATKNERSRLGGSYAQRKRRADLKNKRGDGKRKREYPKYKNT